MSNTVPPNMCALVLEQYATPMRLTYVARPSPRPGQVLVRIKASGVNPLDTKIRLGQAAHAQHPVPAILGIDLASVVAAVGTGVTGFLPGDEVYGLAGGVGGNQGSLAEFSAVDASLLAHKPANLTMREAAVPSFRGATYSEQLYVLAGELAIQVGTDTLVLTTGHSSTIPQGTACSVAASGVEPARVLVIASPSDWAKLIRGVGTSANGSSRPPAAPPDMALLVQLSAEVGDELLGPPGLAPTV